MSGIRLPALDAADMLDVIHYIYEDDLFVAGEGMIEAKDKARSVIYSEMYGRTYKHGADQDMRMPEDLPLNDELDLPVPVDPKAMSSRPKAYTPATKFNPNAANPYVGVLDAPLG
jgi:hypothetical protein